MKPYLVLFACIFAGCAGELERYESKAAMALGSLKRPLPYNEFKLANRLLTVLAGEEPWRSRSVIPGESVGSTEVKKIFGKIDGDLQNFGFVPVSIEGISYEWKR